MKCSSCGAPVRPIVAIDIDGTLAQYHYCFMQFLERWLPTEFIGGRIWHWDGIGEFSDHLGIDKHVYRQAKLAYRTGGFKRWMAAYPGATEFMQSVATLGAEVWITTTRPWMRTDNVDPDTREWLRRNRIPHDHLLFDEDKYGSLCQLVDRNRIVMVLDDEVEQAERCYDLQLPFVLRRTQFNTAVQGPFLYVANQYDTALDMIAERIGAYYALQH